MSVFELVDDQLEGGACHKTRPCMSASCTSAHFSRLIRIPWQLVAHRRYAVFDSMLAAKLLRARHVVLHVDQDVAGWGEDCVVSMAVIGNGIGNRELPEFVVLGDHRGQGYLGVERIIIVIPC